MLTRALALALLVLIAAPARADQTDPRLPALFERLRGTASDAEAADLRDAIWQIWFAAGDVEVDNLMEMGERAMAGGQLGLALAMFDAVIERRPEFAEGWNRRATVLYLGGAFDRSAVDVERVLALEPRHFGALSGMAQILKNTGNKEGALRAFQRVLDIYPMMRSAQSEVATLSEELAGEGI